ncbi:MAG: hypothetical protein D6703_05320 [Zetaproteobacteria bacterium]|nr:MAG: hypothetical protein D6703_05320 [Zetaproteobacteria bacterium]
MVSARLNGRLVAKLAVLQMILALLLALMLEVAGFGRFIPSMLLGVVLMFLNGAALMYTMQRVAVLSRKSGQRLLYAGAAVRFVLLILALVAAHGLGFYLPWVAGGMLVAQVAVYIAGFREVLRWR